jgi:glycine/D-amino acid oxidase-like deaminating enzyme
MRGRPPPAPLATEYAEVPLWHIEARPAVEPQPLPEAADVVVVGSGYCGVTAAAELARRGRACVVLESGDIGAGASTRNAGMVIPELKHSPRALDRRYGALAGQLIAAVFEAFASLEERIETDSIACDYSRPGSLVVASHAVRAAALRAEAREWNERGVDARFVTEDELHDELGSDRFYGGLMLPATGALHPAKLHAALVQRALDGGAVLHPHTRAERVERRRAGGFTVTTNRGAIDTADVFVATNAYADGLLPALRRRVLPIGSFIIATEPLDEPTAHSLIPRGRMVYDTRHFLSYWRLTPDRRMLFGGRTRLGRTSVAEARDERYRAMLAVHPRLERARVAFAWGGSVAITLDRLPHCGRIDGVAYATGCNGTGIAMATWMGARAAAWITGEEPPPPFAQLPFARIPLRGLQSTYLPALGWGLRALDRIGR